VGSASVPMPRPERTSTVVAYSSALRSAGVTWPSLNRALALAAGLLTALASGLLTGRR
jgi:hypothetical protein